MVLGQVLRLGWTWGREGLFGPTESRVLLQDSFTGMGIIALTLDSNFATTIDDSDTLISDIEINTNYL